MKQALTIIVVREHLPEELATQITDELLQAHSSVLRNLVDSAMSKEISYEVDAVTTIEEG